MNEISVNILLTIGLLLSGFNILAQDGFVPVTFEKIHTVKVYGSPEQIFSLIGPEGTKKVTGANVDYLFGGANDLPGAMFRIGDRWFVVAEYNREELIYRSVMLMPRDELLVNEFTLRASEDANTYLTVKWRVTGFDKGSNLSIEEFLLHEGIFEQQVESIGKKLNEYLGKSR